MQAWNSLHRVKLAGMFHSGGIAAHSSGSLFILGKWLNTSLWWDCCVMLQQPGGKPVPSPCRHWGDSEDDEEGDGWPTDAEVGALLRISPAAPPARVCSIKARQAFWRGGGSGCARSGRRWRDLGRCGDERCCARSWRRRRGRGGRHCHP